MDKTTANLHRFSSDTIFERKPLEPSAESFLWHYGFNPLDRKQVESYRRRVQEDYKEKIGTQNCYFRLIYNLFHKSEFRKKFSSFVSVMIFISGLLSMAHGIRTENSFWLTYGVVCVALFFAILVIMFFEVSAEKKSNTNWVIERLDLNRYRKINVSSQMGEYIRDKVLNFIENGTVNGIRFYKESHEYSGIYFILVCDDKGGKYYIDYNI